MRLHIAKIGTGKTYCGLKTSVECGPYSRASCKHCLHRYDAQSTSHLSPYTRRLKEKFPKVKTFTASETRVRIRNYLGMTFDLDGIQAARAYIIGKPGLNGPPDPIRHLRNVHRMKKTLQNIGRDFI